MQANSDRQELFFEINDSGNIVRLEPINLIKQNSDLDWDKNWIKTEVTIKCKSFNGKYIGDFMTVDFEKFKQELSLLYDNLNGIANFNDLEGYLNLNIVGDGLGRFEVNVVACDQLGNNSSKLTYKIHFDQTEIKTMLDQLDSITKKFPIIGDFKIKNK